MDFRNLLLFPNISAKIMDLLPTEEINKPPLLPPPFSDILYKFKTFFRWPPFWTVENNMVISSVF